MERLPKGALVALLRGDMKGRDLGRKKPEKTR